MIITTKKPLLLMGILFAFCGYPMAQTQDIDLHGYQLMNVGSFGVGSGPSSYALYVRDTATAYLSTMRINEKNDSACSGIRFQNGWNLVADAGYGRPNMESALLRNKVYFGTQNLTDLAITTNDQVRMVFAGKGPIGIGTLRPDPGCLLSVNGEVRAKSLTVTDLNWADDVFSKDYQLKEIRDVEKHIQEHGHLEGIPSQKEVESAGISVASMSAALLRKIEELTLHQIELQTEREQLQQRIAVLRKAGRTSNENQQ